MINLKDTRKKNNTSYKIFFVNVHLPFDSAALTRNSIQRVLESFKHSPENVVVFGDFNSRSLFNNSCAKIASHLQSDQKFICEGVGYTKDVSFDSVSELQEDLNKCSSEKRTSKSCGHLSDNLKYNDLLSRDNVIDQYEFQELDLYSWPSYKLNDETGAYSLQKGRHGRLPGYADRIIFKGEFDEVVDYRLHKYRGNDHFPISLTLVLEKGDSLA